MTKWLGKAGKIINTIGQVLGLFSPAITTLFPGAKEEIKVVSQDIAQIADIIVLVEGIGQAGSLPGADKLKVAAPLVAQVILKSSIMAKHDIDVPVLFNQGVTKVADGMADILNSLKGDPQFDSKV